MVQGVCDDDDSHATAQYRGVAMIYADGMHGRFRPGFGAQFIHVAAAMAGDRAV